MSEGGSPSPESGGAASLYTRYVVSWICRVRFRVHGPMAAGDSCRARAVRARVERGRLGACARLLSLYDVGYSASIVDGTTSAVQCGGVRKVTVSIAGWEERAGLRVGAAWPAGSWRNRVGGLHNPGVIA